MHDLTGRAAAQVNAFFHQAAQVAVSKNSQHALPVIHHGGGAQALVAHLAHQVGKRGLRPYPRHGVAAAHDVMHMRQQFSAQRATGVGAGKILFPETARVQQRHGQRVAQRELRRGAGSWRQVQRAGFPGHTAVQNHVSLPGQRRLQSARDGDERHAQPAQHRQDRDQFFALAAIGNGQHQVAGLDHAQIAMAGFGRMHEKCRRSGRCERRGNFPADMPALAHAHDDHPAAAGHHAANRLDKLAADTRGESKHGRRLYLESLPGKAQHLGCVKVRGIKSHGSIL